MDIEDLRRALRRLIADYWLYFDKQGYLNSDGRRLLASIAKQAKRLDYNLSRRLWKTLRDPSVDNILKLADTISLNLRGELDSSLNGPQAWRFREWRRGYKVYTRT
ncbi:MAG: hypothetical protein GSR85_06675 [Desulfurococcales archaeon]|nr:hypothetical protein [Desulfurococcales archaeon]